MHGVSLGVERTRLCHIPAEVKPLPEGYMLPIIWTYHHKTMCSVSCPTYPERSLRGRHRFVGDIRLLLLLPVTFLPFAWTS